MSGGLGLWGSGWILWGGKTPKPPLAAATVERGAIQVQGRQPVFPGPRTALHFLTWESLLRDRTLRGRRDSLTFCREEGQAEKQDAEQAGEG